MVHLSLEIETTRDIARQILRHRSFSFQEFSQRYADPTKDLDFVLRECRLQDTKNRQNSVEVIGDTEDNRFLIAEWERRQQEVITLVKEHYTWAVGASIAKEQARKLLPEGLTMSRMYMAGNLRSWLHYVDIRCDAATQKEHREVAEQVKLIICEQFPAVKELFYAQELNNAY
jgi:thymidylate synthase (FAD)